jgi:hypothetical protein
MLVPKGQTMYRVVQELFIPANSPRHAARIAKGLQRMMDGEMPTQYTVEEAQQAYSSLYLVDLSKAKEEEGYCEQVR